jgi:hypothetical protein
LLHQAQEQQAARSRCPAIEAEGVLVQVIVEMLGADRSLVRADLGVHWFSDYRYTTPEAAMDSPDLCGPRGPSY